MDCVAFFYVEGKGGENFRKVNLNFGVDEDEGPHEDLNEREVSEEASVSSPLAKASKNLMKVVTKKLKSVQMTTILRASKMN